MDRNEYFQAMKELARAKRQLFEVDTSNFGLREVRRIFSAENIKVDYWPLPKKIKAIYMCSDSHFSAAIQKKLPDEPKLFALVHELKHHFNDQELILNGAVHCGDYNANEEIEIGAEVFAAEFIYPEGEFLSDISQLEINSWQAEDLVRFKHNCKAKVSYQFLQKRLTWFGKIKRDQFKNVQFKKLEETIFGVPFYKRRRDQTA